MSFILISGGPIPPESPPYVSCIDGHVVKTLDQCPPVPKHSRNDAPPLGGGGGRGGLLGLGIGGIL